MKPKTGRKWVVLAAIIANALIAVTKAIASAITGSAAMLSEAVHSIVDTSNQILVLWGLKRSSRPADEKHPFGYGMELYFWTFVVAILIFAIGAGVSLYAGISKIENPTELTNIHINYFVLGFALIFEASAWTVAFREFRKRKGNLGYIKAFKSSKDPAVFTVLFEDSAAILGLTAAFIGLLLAQITGNPIYDAAASIAIAMILGCTAALLAFETKGLLIGESASSEVITGIRKLVLRESNILTINEILTMHLGPEDILLNISIDFHDNISAGAVERTISRLEKQIKEKYPEVARIFIEAQNWQAHEENANGPDD
ncbi:MAG: cation diffusion facilitator family transporter [Gammaproteobacteria bacterium]|nr:cation diffusion facilitator family transporter [Gammaproteobacteria bacterium]MCY4219068.1 cation diffusion facilitator family transporter [Gammaproteobacteria bacterium]MCY4276004.1 cation diffusion facilitator family transporter [Gammaproteobacteria bacterium]